MYPYRFSKIERFWLLAVRLAWQYRDRGGELARLLDRLFAQVGLGPRGHAVLELLDVLESAGADHLYIERYDQPGLTGDERDLLRALKACYLDDLLGAEAALGALLPPGRTDAALGALQAVTFSVTPARTVRTDPISDGLSLSAAACH